MKKALITGIAGQDGSYLAEFLLSKGYAVYGMIMKGESLDIIKDIKEKVVILEGNLTDDGSLIYAVKKSMPDEIYHLAAMSFVGISWDKPVLTGDVNALGTTRLLEAVRKIVPKAKFYNASTSEMFGITSDIKTEDSPFHPRNPYAISKCFSHWMAVNYRESYNMFICCGIMFNHESPRRGKDFVTKKIAKGVVDIKDGTQECLYLGNIDSVRDWGYAKDYVEAMWLMLQQDKPDDYIISTGETHSVREFLEETFNAVGISIRSNGKKGIKEEYIRTDTNKTVVRISKALFRPVELTVLKGKNDKAKTKLNWEPKMKFKELVKIMVEYEVSHS